MELLLIRHALPQRVVNRDGKPADPPLSDHGRAQAASLARWLSGEPLHAIYTSPLQRASETARPLADATELPVEVEPGVVELDHLSDTYVPLEELKAANREQWLELIRGGLYAGIDLELFRHNVTASVERIIADHPNQRVAIVCHGGVINAWAAHVLGIEAPLFFDPTYTSINRFLAARSGERSVASLNEMAHLRELRA